MEKLARHINELVFFLENVVTRNDNWVQNFQLESRNESLERKIPENRQRKKMIWFSWYVSQNGLYWNVTWKRST